MRALSRNLSLFLGLFLVSACAHFSAIETVPAPYMQRLGKHPAWVTVASFRNPPGTFPPSETVVVKRWEVRLKNGRAAALVETGTSSLFGEMRMALRGDMTRLRVDLRDEIDTEAFLPAPGSSLHAARPYAADEYSFKEIDADRFQIEINGGAGRIVFSPAAKDGFAAKALKDRAYVGIWTTPFGAESELLEHFKKALAKESPKAAEAMAEQDDRSYLHHDVTSPRKIRLILDKSFPEAYRGAVPKAARKWNGLFRKELFVVEPKARVIDYGDCLTGFKICLRWIGPPELAFTGANGYTELSFDPDTGLILGGVVSVINDDVVLPLSDLTPGERQRVLADKLDWDWVAGAMLRYHELDKKRHPLPEPYVEYLVLHEMGHMNGFGHNFYTRKETDADHPVSSVLSYPPFPVGHRANELTASDQRRLELVYRPKEGQTDPGYCSSMEAMAPEKGEDGIYRKPSSCDVFTLGDPAEWYIRLAKQGRFGVFTGYPDLSNLSDELRRVYREAALRRRLPPLNILTRLGFILGDSEPANAKSRESIENFLCGLATDRSAIASQLKEFHRFDLQCYNKN